MNAVAFSGVSPIMVRPTVSKVIVDTTGRPALAAAATAASNSPNAKTVSIQSTSVPPSASACACSAKIDSASSPVNVP